MNMKNLVNRLKTRIDRNSKAKPWVGFPLAVVKKFGEDRAGQQAALVAYFGFFSLFPLLLVFATVLGIVLRGHAALQTKVLDSALSQFPIIGTQLRENVGSFSGGGVALAIGIAGALWGGLGGIKAMQNAMDVLWDVPIKRQGGFFKRLMRAAVMLAVLGVFAITAAGLSSVSTALADVSPLTRVVTLLLSVGVNLALFLIAFRVLTVADVSWRDVFPGAAVAGVIWTVLQLLGSFIVNRQLRGASELYGFFGVVLGLLSWLYLGAQMTLLSAEVNVVKKLHLWPRSLEPKAETEADKRALERHAKVEERTQDEEVGVDFDPSRRAAS
jgi:YihY family inner membrane protein